jgi:hypothetical protein
MSTEAPEETINFITDSEFIPAPDPEFTQSEDIKADFAEPLPESRLAKEYRKKVTKALGPVWRGLLGSPVTVPDAATILTYGPDLAKAAGHLAEENPKARKIIDFITDGSDNPYAQLIAVAIPMSIQLIRNHEQALKPRKSKRVTVKIPFTRFSVHFPLQLGITLGRFRNMSHEPSELTYAVFSDPHISAALQKQGIQVNFASTNGHKKS